MWAGRMGSSLSRRRWVAEDIQQLVALEPGRGRGIGGVGKAHQRVARVLGGRGCIHLKGLTPFLGANRPNVTSVAVHMCGPTDQRRYGGGHVRRRLPVNGYAVPLSVFQVPDRKRRDGGEARGVDPLGADTPL